MKEERQKKVIAVFVAIGLTLVIFVGVLFAMRETLFFFFAPRIYTLEKLEMFYEELKKEGADFENEFFNGNSFKSEEYYLSFWNYVKSEDEKKQGDLSFDLSVDKKNSRAEFAYDNTKAKKIKDLFVYVDKDELGANFPDFSDDYWITDGKNGIDNYNKSALRTLLGKDEIKYNPDLSFEGLFRKKSVDKKKKVVILKNLIKSVKYKNKKCIDFKNKEYIVNFSVNPKYVAELFELYSNYNISSFIGNEDIDFNVFLEKSHVMGFDIITEGKYDMKFDFSSSEKYIEDFKITFNIKDEINPVKFTLCSQIQGKINNVFVSKLSLTSESSLGNKMVVSNSAEISKGKIKGSLNYGVNNDLTGCSYNGSFDNSDGFLINLTNVKGENMSAQTGVYFSNIFNPVSRKTQNKVEILNMQSNELISYASKTGGNDITKLFLQ